MFKYFLTLSAAMLLNGANSCEIAGIYVTPDQIIGYVYTESQGMGYYFMAEYFKAKYFGENKENIKKLSFEEAMQKFKEGYGGFDYGGDVPVTKEAFLEYMNSMVDNTGEIIRGSGSILSDIVTNTRRIEFCCFDNEDPSQYLEKLHAFVDLAKQYAGPKFLSLIEQNLRTLLSGFFISLVDCALENRLPEESVRAIKIFGDSLDSLSRKLSNSREEENVNVSSFEEFWRKPAIEKGIIDS